MFNSSYTDRLTGPQREVAELVQKHAQHDLTTSDRELLQSAGKKMGLYTTIGASVGLGLGLFLSLRLRRASYSIYNAAKKVEQPTALQFADGHTVPFPADASEIFRPTTLGQILSGFFFSTAGFFLGGELGLLAGSASASSTVNADPQARGRIEAAFRNLRIDMLRRQADDLEKATTARGGNGGILGDPPASVESKLV